MDNRCRTVITDSSPHVALDQPAFRYVETGASRSSSPSSTAIPINADTTLFCMEATSSMGAPASVLPHSWLAYGDPEPASTGQ